MNDKTINSFLSVSRKSDGQADLPSVPSWLVVRRMAVRLVVLLAAVMSAPPPTPAPSPTPSAHPDRRAPSVHRREVKSRFAEKLPALWKMIHADGINDPPAGPAECCPGWYHPGGLHGPTHLRVGFVCTLVVLPVT